MDRVMKRFVANLKTPNFAALIPNNVKFTSSAPNHTEPRSSTAPHTTSLQPKYVAPPIPHPCPYDHIALLITAEGLLLRPHLEGPTRPVSHVRISWDKTVVVESLEGDGEREGVDWNDCVIVYGIVGVLELFSSSYIMVITAKSDVGHLFDTSHTVYCVKDVTAIPLVQDRARTIVNKLASRNAVLLRPSLLPLSSRPTGGTTVSEELQYAKDPPTKVVQFSDDDQVKFISPLPSQQFNPHEMDDDTMHSSGASTPSFDDSVNMSSVAKVLANRLSFWNRISARTRIPLTEGAGNEPLTVVDRQQSLDTIFKEGTGGPTSEFIDSILAETAPAPATSEERHSQLEDKVVRECVREYTKGGMYFSYNFDLTRSLQHKQEHAVRSQRQHDLLVDLQALSSEPSLAGDQQIQALAEPSPTLPLWRRVDREFWWNERLSKPFVDAGLHSYVLPIMQGYYQISSFQVPREPLAQEQGDHALVDYIVISRRSRDRAGLRYQRRGIDDHAHVANFVETETIMRVEREGFSNVFSYVQIRGSIPLFWTQSGYGLKPPPQLSPDRTRTENLDVMKRHFQRNIPRYGPHVIVNLAEQQGKEGAISQAFQGYMQEMGWKEAEYHEYDFHKETKGMKYENISHLVESMERVFDLQGFFWVSDNSIMSKQKGVFRVNCIDCLDRTNVVQSAFARHVLDKQLGAMALFNPEFEGSTDTDVVFNDVWANNGDAISRAYAGTSALKGDFTRTGKRDLSGLLNDGVNSLARMYSSTFSDWFCQAVIDFMLGYRNLTVFSEFLLKLQSTDPQELIRLSKIRAEAISTSVSRVLTEGERLLHGWTVLAPEQFNAKIGVPFEEKVLLLTVKAIYIISYDYTLEKVKMYTRVPLGDILGITKGAYILSPLEEASRDPTQNAGFVVSWLNSNQITRLTSYSMRNSPDMPSSPPPSPLKPNTFLTPARKQLQALSRKSTLSKILYDASIPAASERTFAAFKVLPIDSARRQGTSSGPATVEDTDYLIGASTCKEVADALVDAIKSACEDLGSSHGDFVTEADVVSLAEAQRMTTMYAKVEYGLKRLLWLGG